MKKILIILFLFISVLSLGQGRYPISYAQAAEEAPSYDSDVTAYINGLSTPIVDSILTRINTFVVALKDSLNITDLADGFDIMYILANHNEVAALRNLVERDNDATNASSTTFTVGEGYTGDGLVDYLNTGFNPATEGATYTLNNASYGGYIRIMNYEKFWAVRR